MFLISSLVIMAEPPWSISQDHPVTMNENKKPQKPATETSGFFTFFRKYISPLDGSSCHYYPTCSRYSEKVIARYGIIKGGVMTTDRLIRCHQGQKEPGFDPPFDYNLE